MVQTNARPLQWRPRGVSDAVDGTNAFRGAMASLQNLVPSPTTPGTFVPRAASSQLTDFSGYTLPTAVSARLVLGTRVYGMLSSNDYPGKDLPFCYDIATSSFVAISGVASGNLPVSQPTVGDWEPPIMAVVGTKIVVTHPGFAVGANKFGWIDISNPAALAWSAGDTSTNPLPARPMSVCQFNGRAWYACGKYLVFSDALNATVVTNASQALVIGDTTNITALGGVPLYSYTTGGSIQSLIAFKGASTAFQIQGDQATNNLSINELSGAVGTLAPNTIAATPMGLAFVAPDGLRIIDTNGQVSDPIGANGEGVANPFISAVAPSRMCATFNQNTLVISVQNGVAAGQPWQEYWLDFKQKTWTGPHTFAGELVSAYHNPTGQQGLIKVPAGKLSALFFSPIVPTVANGYVENGVVITWAYQPVLLPDNGAMQMNQIVESTIAMSLPSGQQVTVTATDEASNLLGQVALIGAYQGSALWGSFQWGAVLWGGAAAFFKQYRIPWPAPLVFKQANIRFTGDAQWGFSIADLNLRYRILGYLLQLIS